MQECLHAWLAWVVEVTNYGIRHGVAGALAAAQLRRGGLRGLEPGFRPRSSFRDREGLIVYFQPAITTVSAVMDVPDIILYAPHE